MKPLDIKFHARQTDAFLSKATEMLYGGAAGGGKSFLLRAASTIWSADIAGLQCYLFRRLSDDLFKNHMTGSGSYVDILSPWLKSKHASYNGQKNCIEFWNGSRIWLCHCQYEKDVVKYQGAEINLLMFDELTHFTEYQYRFLRGRLRLGGLKVPDKYKDVFPRIIAGSNPGGIGHNFVRRTWVSDRLPEQIYSQSPIEGGLKRQHIPALLGDNPTLMQNDPDYINRLEALGNPALVKAMRDGDWNIVAGGALDDLWDTKLIILPRFKIPAGWRIDRSFDWGSRRPFSVGWWGEADGTEAVLPNGNIFCPVKGSLIRFAEWYGAKEAGTNEGLNIGAADVADGIRQREQALRAAGFISSEVFAGPADNSIETVAEKRQKSIASVMRERGVHWTASNKSAGSRMNGLELVRMRLRNNATMDGAGLYITDNCTAALTTLPVLPRDPKNMDDVDSDAEDHIYDEIRYRVLADEKRYAKNINVTFST